MTVHDELTTADPVVKPIEADPLDARAKEFNERIRSKFGTPTEREAVQPSEFCGFNEDLLPPWMRSRQAHEHHFTYQLNQGNTALRGCTCGLAFVTLCMGEPESLTWHQIYELPASE